MTGGVAAITKAISRSITGFFRPMQMTVPKTAIGRPE